MEDIVKFLIVAGIIIFGLVRQMKKEAKKKADDGPIAPIPDAANPLPENWNDGTYGGFIPKGPEPEATPKLTKKPTNRIDTLSKQKIAPPPSIIEPEVEETSEFAIHSAEEARRAIIWSEILQRKY